MKLFFEMTILTATFLSVAAMWAVVQTRKMRRASLAVVSDADGSRGDMKTDNLMVGVNRMEDAGTRIQKERSPENGRWVLSPADD